MKLSEFYIVPPGTISVDNIWIDDKPYKLDDDGDTLLDFPDGALPDCFSIVSSQSKT